MAVDDGSKLLRDADAEAQKFISSDKCIKKLVKCNAPVCRVEAQCVGCISSAGRRGVCVWPYPVSRLLLFSFSPPIIVKVSVIPYECSSSTVPFVRLISS